MNEQDNHVDAVTEKTPSRSLAVRFDAAKASDNPKAPIARCLVSLDGTLRGMVLDFPIFRGKDGNGISVSMPGGKSFPAIKAQPIIANGYITTAPEPEGAELERHLPDLVKTAYFVWQTTKTPDQVITFP